MRCEKAECRRAISNGGLKVAGRKYYLFYMVKMASGLKTTRGNSFFQNSYGLQGATVVMI